MRKYSYEPFLLTVKNQALLAEIRKIFGSGSAWIQSPSKYPLLKGNIDRATVCETTDRNWIGLIENTLEQPIYDILAIDDNGTITVQLEKEWEEYRDSALEAIAERLAEHRHY